MARNQDQNNKMRQERMAQIRLVALRQFSSQGLLATRISDIAKEVGMAQGLIYHYYPSKDAIFVDLINEALDKINEASIELRAMDMPAKNKILVALETLFKTIETSEAFSETCRLIAQATNTTAIPEEARLALESKRDIPYEAVADIMEAGQKEGTIISGNPRMLATLFWTGVNGLAIYAATRDKKIDIPDYRIMASMFFI